MKRTDKQHRWSLLPLRYKLGIYFFAFAAIMLAFLWVFQMAFLEMCYTSIKLNQVKKCAGIISGYIKQGDDAPATINEFSRENEMSVYVYDSSESIIMPRYTSDFNNPTGRSEMEMHKVYNYYRLTLENDGNYVTTTSLRKDRGERLFISSRISSTDDEISESFIIESKNNAFLSDTGVRNMIYGEIIGLDDDNECFLLITAMITPVNAVVSTLRIQLIVVSVIFTIFAIILAFVVSKRISKPIVEMNTAAKELSRQNYDMEFTGNGYLEVQELSDTLNLTRHQLRKVEALRQELIANISHDLRTPLTMITGYSEVMRDLPDENTPENIQVIIDEANRLTSLVNDMLDLSKLQSGAMEIDREIYCLTDSIQDIFLRYCKLREQDGYNISFTADKRVFVNADEVKIGQVIYNFINNAINHCGDDKTVKVTQKVSQGKVRIEVQDFGEGIPADKLEYIWDRYYKVDKVHKRGVIGTGLGLSIVKRILEMHGARYGVRSKEGSGSVFWFELEYTATQPIKHGVSF